MEVLNANQRRKNRRKGVFTNKDKQQADRFAKFLYKLHLSDETLIYGGNEYAIKYTYSNFSGFAAAAAANTSIYNAQGRALEVEDIDAALRAIKFP